MKVNLLKSKIHNCIVTNHNVQYQGSILIDSELINAAKMYVNEIFSGLNPKNKPKASTFENKYKYGEMLVEKNNDKNTVVALREIGEGKVAIEELKKNAVLRLRKEPNESDEEVIEEEVSNDDFEKEYKGEVSKSGVAILPSKRMRKAPIQNTSSPDDKKEPETTLQLTDEVKSEPEDKSSPSEEEKK